MNKAYNKCLFTRLPGTPGIRGDSRQFTRNHASNSSSPGSDKMTEVQLYMSTLCHLGCRVIRAFSDVEMPFLFSNLAV